MALEKRGKHADRPRRELRLKATPDFPCTGYHVYLTFRSEDAIDWHTNEEIELFFVKEGRLFVHFPGKELTLTSGEGVLILPGLLHSTQADGYCELFSLIFKKELLMGSADSVFAMRYFQPVLSCPDLRFTHLTGERDSLTLDALQNAFDALSEEPVGYELLVLSHLARMWYHFYRDHDTLLRQVPALSDSAKTDELRMQKMLLYLHSHFQEHIHLEDIAKEASIGPRECLRCFQRTIGVPPMRYLLEYRINYGAALLSTTELPVAEIAASSGFDSPSNFAQAFRRLYGLTPRAYRQQEGSSEKT